MVLMIAPCSQNLTREAGGQAEELNQSEVAKLRSESEAQVLELTRARDELTELQAEVKERDQELARRRAEVAQLRAESEKAVQRRAVTDARIKDLQAEIQSRDEERASLLSQWDQQMALADKGQPLRPLSSVSRVRKMPKSAFSGVSDAAPQAVYTGPRDPKQDRVEYKYDGSRDAKPQYTELRKRLTAPIAGFLSAGLEITLVS